MKPEEKKVYSIQEMILLLLGLNENNPLKKKLLIREAFLFEKEFFNDMNMHFKSAEFTPGKYGPESKLIINTLNSMYDLIMISPTQKQEIYLTTKGKIKARKFINMIEIEKINKIKYRKDGWDQWGVQIILKKIQKDYPEYILPK